MQFYVFLREYIKVHKEGTNLIHPSEAMVQLTCTIIISYSVNDVFTENHTDVPFKGTT